MTLAPRTRAVTYEAEGVLFVSELFVPECTVPAPALLVFPDIKGLGVHARERAVKLAELGYVVLAADLHGGGAVLAFNDAMNELDRLSRDVRGARARGRAHLAALLAQGEVNRDKIGAIGFCYGGTMALELARSGASIAAVVAFHSELATSYSEDAFKIRGKVLACIGSDDGFVPLEQRLAFETEMRAAGVDWQLHVYGGVVHSFTDKRADAARMPDRARYDPKADARSWAAMRELLRETLD